MNVNLRAVAAILGFLLIIEGALMGAVVPVTLIYPGDDTFALVFSSLSAIAAGMALWYFFKEHRQNLGKREGFAVVAFGWVVASLFGCMPFLISGAIPSFTNAYFETMSGFTTTGSTILSDIEILPRGILLWRSMTQWIGGLGIVLISVAILPMLGVAGMQLISAEVSHVKMEKLTPRIGQTARLLWIVYISLTALQTLLLKLGGMGWYDALAHSFTTVSSGGFSTRNASIAAFDSPFIHYVIIIFMFIAGVSFNLHFRLLQGRWKSYWDDQEFRLYGILVLAGCVVVFFGVPMLDQGYEWRFRVALFQTVSILSSTGFITADYELWGPAAQFLLLVFMFHCACAGSTTGGIKLGRILLLVKSSIAEVKKLVHPRAIYPVRFNGRSVSPEIIQSVQSFLVLYMAIFALASVALAFCGLDIVTAGSAAVTALSNVGPGFGSVGAVENFGHLSGTAKWILTFCMLVGRLEIYTVLVLFSRTYWRG